MGCVPVGWGHPCGLPHHSRGNKEDPVQFGSWNEHYDKSNHQFIHSISVFEYLLFVYTIDMNGYTLHCIRCACQKKPQRLIIHGTTPDAYFNDDFSVVSVIGMWWILTLWILKTGEDAPISRCCGSLESCFSLVSMVWEQTNKPFRKLLQFGSCTVLGKHK